MNGRGRLASAVQFFLAISVPLLLYVLFVSIYNEMVGEERQLEVVTGVITVVAAGSLSILLLWIYQQNRRKRE